MPDVLGFVCADVCDEVISSIQKLTNAKIIVAPKNTSSRRFIYLANLLHNAIRLSHEHFVVVRTNWIQELANSGEDFVAAARAIDRVCLRFGVVNITSEETFKKALLKMETLQCPREDIFVGVVPAEEIVYRAALAHAMHPTWMLNPDLTNLSGSPTAKALLVGEQINPYLEFPHWPFFDDRDSAQFISRALEKGNVLETDLLWTNALHPSENVLKIILRFLPAMRVVALGSVADKILTSMGVSHSRVSHPQYARRFESKNDYDVVLEKAIKG